MELTCPACGARYAAPEDAVPATGRTVRCSACRAEWIARPKASEASPPPQGPAPRAVARTAPAPSAAAAARDPGARLVDAGAPPPSLGAERPDPTRRAVSPPPEPAARPAAVEPPAARPAAVEPPANEPPAAEPASPDPAMIGSLEADEPPRRRHRGAFAAGFLLAALVAVAAAGAYWERERLEAFEPRLAAPLALYGERVDEGRRRLALAAEDARRFVEGFRE